MPFSLAYSISSSLDQCKSLIGSSIFISGTNAWIPTSKRTWSFPLPVHPCAIAVAPCSLATSTSFFTIKGRDKADTKGDLFS